MNIKLLLLSIISIFVFVSCGDSSSNNDDPDTNVISSLSVDDGVVIPTSIDK
jgi:hypothetical protein